MKIRSICLALFMLGHAGGMCAQNSEAFTPIGQSAVTTLHVPGFADFLVAGDAVWATNRGRVEKLERDHPRPVATVSVREPCGAMAIGFGASWVANCKDGSLNRIDLEPRRVSAVIPTGLADPDGELSIAVGAESVWLLTDERGVLSRVDLQTNRVSEQIKVAPYSYAAVFGFGSVWITNTGKGNRPVDSFNGLTPARIGWRRQFRSVPRHAFLQREKGGVWILNQGDGSVSRIDPSSNEVIATILVGVEGPGGDIATGAGAVWVRAVKALLSVIRSETNRVVERFGPPAGSDTVRVAGKFIWLTAHDNQTVWILPAPRER